MSRINDDVLTCILWDLDLMDEETRSGVQHTYFSLTLGNKALQYAVTPRLYRFPLLDIRNIYGFTDTVGRRPDLAAHVRGIAFDSRRRSSIYGDWRAAEQEHKRAVLAFQEIMARCEQLDAFASNFRRDWRLETEWDLPPANPSQDLFRAIFGRFIDDIADSSALPFKHIHVEDPENDDGLINVWRCSYFVESIRPGIDSSLDLEMVEMSAMDGRADNGVLPLRVCHTALRLTWCIITSDMFADVLSRLGESLVELYIHSCDLDIDIQVTAVPPICPNLRLLETDSLDHPCLPVPSLQTLRLTAFDLSTTRSLLAWLNLPDTVGIRLIVFLAPEMGTSSTYVISQPDYSEIQNDAAALEEICRDRGIVLRPSIGTVIKWMLEKTRITEVDEGSLTHGDTAGALA